MDFLCTNMCSRVHVDDNKTRVLLDDLTDLDQRKRSVLRLYTQRLERR